MSLYAQFGNPDKDSDYIEGPCQITPHVKWFEPSSLSLEHPRPKPISNSPGATRSENQIRGVWLTLPVDEKTSLLFQANANGTLFKSVLIDFLAENKDPLQLQLSDVIISSIQISAGRDPTSAGSVLIKLDFAKFRFDYKVDPDKQYGSAAQSIGWDVKSAGPP
jgi:type VI protein secretion system component Hcp